MPTAIARLYQTILMLDVGLKWLNSKTACLIWRMFNCPDFMQILLFSEHLIVHNLRALQTRLSEAMLCIL